MGKTVRNCGILLFAGIVTGFLLLLLVFALPKQAMFDNVKDSVEALESDCRDEEVVFGYSATLKGMFTDSLMLQNAVYEAKGRNILEQAMGIYRGELSKDFWVPGDAVIRYVSGESLPYEESYARYWHGYLVLLKPLLLFLNLANLQLLGSVLQPLLLGVIIWLFFKRGKIQYGLAYAVTILCIYPMSMELSLSQSICHYITLTAVILQLIKHEKIQEKKHYPEFFLLLGMVTAYLDLLTYPLITLGIPLCVYAVLSRDTYKEQMKQIRKCIPSWVVGYGGMWAAKWILSDVLLGTGVIADAVDVVLFRTSNAQSYNRFTGFFHVIALNLKPYFNWGYLFLLLLLFGFCTTKLIRGRKNMAGAEIKGASLVFGIFCLLPFGWFFVTQNHSSEHWMFTYKILAVSIFAFLCWVLTITAPKEAAERHGSS